jgi:hypothetical protein
LSDLGDRGMDGWQIVEEDARLAADALFAVPPT